ncbi:hypothetical protein J6590_067221 [Homalodisca vitripennis]|nr:hypothetical protein J6590_067221 [Homalodisca vitripennis]
MSSVIGFNPLPSPARLGNKSVNSGSSPLRRLESEQRGGRDIATIGGLTAKSRQRVARGWRVGMMSGGVGGTLTMTSN